MEDFEAFARDVGRAIVVGVLILVTLLALTGCGGGGDDEEDEHADARPPQCQKQPELCK